LPTSEKNKVKRRRSDFIGFVCCALGFADLRILMLLREDLLINDYRKGFDFKKNTLGCLQMDNYFREEKMYRTPH
jgi:hypothetical protein